MTGSSQVLYWDASAVLSLLFADCHSATALEWWQSGSIHLLSTLAFVETHAVITRLERSKALSTTLTQEARHNLTAWPWRRTTAQPAWEVVDSLANRWPLRGADLWHLACATSLHQQLPELHLLTFDNSLQEAAQGEGLLRQ